MYNICEIITFIKIILTTHFRDLMFIKEQKGDIEASAEMVGSSKKCIYFKKCTSVFTMCGILVANLDCHFPAVDG
jgi:hypothetical protein